jgi:hypothetical protein
MSCVWCSNLTPASYPVLNLAQFVMKVKVCVEFFWRKGVEFPATGDLLNRLVAVAAGRA